MRYAVNIKGEKTSISLLGFNDTAFAISEVTMLPEYKSVTNVTAGNYA